MWWSCFCVVSVFSKLYFFSLVLLRPHIFTFCVKKSEQKFIMCIHVFSCAVGVCFIRRELKLMLSQLLSGELKKKRWEEEGLMQPEDRQIQSNTNGHIASFLRSANRQYICTHCEINTIQKKMQVLEIEVWFFFAWRKVHVCGFHISSVTVLPALSRFFFFFLFGYFIFY